MISGAAEAGGRGNGKLTIVVIVRYYKIKVRASLYKTLRQGVASSVKLYRRLIFYNSMIRPIADAMNSTNSTNPTKSEVGLNEPLPLSLDLNRSMNKVNIITCSVHLTLPCTLRFMR